MSSLLRFELCRPDQLGPHTAALRAIEASITYPIDGDRFTIDHGAEYGAFLASLGEAYFLLPFEGDRLLGVIGAALRTVHRPGRSALKALYIADLKLIPEARGGRISRRLFAHGLRLLFTHPDAAGLRFVFGAGMQGTRGDVRRTFQRAHVGRLGSGLGRLALFFVDPRQLASLQGHPPPIDPAGIDLSGDSSPLIRPNHGCKDFRLESTGEPWRLAHLPRPPMDLGTMLRSAADELDADELATFALDERLVPQLRWLADNGLHPGASCNLLGLGHPLLGLNPLRAPWLHLSTAEI